MQYKGVQRARGMIHGVHPGFGSRVLSPYSEQQCTKDRHCLPTWYSEACTLMSMFCGHLTNRSLVAALRRCRNEQQDGYVGSLGGLMGMGGPAPTPTCVAN